MLLLQSDLEVVTKYGRLTVPAADVRRIEFGVHLPDGVGKKIDEAIKKLGSETPAERDAAGKELVNLGAWAYPALNTALESADPEVRRRADEALKRIRARVPAGQLRARLSDHIQTAEFPVVGRISSPTIKARSAYFGEKELQVSDLVSLRAMSKPGTSELVVDAGKYGSPPQQWLDTGLEIDADMPLTIAASGQVDLWEDGTGQYVTGPAGLKGAAANGMPVPVAAQAGFGGRRGGGAAAAHVGGALLGRIGETGSAFVIGESFKGKAPQQGRLYLSIAVSPWGNPSVGAYKVKVTVGDAK
jgi:hypothetical protein